MIRYPIPLDILDRTHLAHRAEMPANLTAAELEPDLHDRLHAAWMRVVCTQQQVLAALAHLGRLTPTEHGQAIDAGELGLNDCQEAIRSLDAGDGTGPSDYWLGRCSPTAAFQRLEAWFQAALATLRVPDSRGRIERQDAGAPSGADPYERAVWPMDEMP